MTCAEVREAAAELVLGTLDGERRVEVVAHLAGCAECRAEVESLTRVTDALWLAAPEAEPDAGFETRVLRAIGTRSRFGGPWVRRVLSAAAVVLALVVGLVVGSLRAPEPAVAAGPMLDTARAKVGNAVVGRGAAPYVFVTVDGWGHGGEYVVEVVRTDGSHVAVAPIRLGADGRGEAGGRLPVPFRDVGAVWVTDAAHTEWCAFRLR